MIGQMSKLKKNQPLTSVTGQNHLEIRGLYHQCSCITRHHCFPTAFPGSHISAWNSMKYLSMQGLSQRQQMAASQDLCNLLQLGTVPCNQLRSLERKRGGKNKFPTLSWISSRQLECCSEVFRCKAVQKKHEHISVSSQTANQDFKPYTRDHLASTGSYKNNAHCRRLVVVPSQQKEGRIGAKICKQKHPKLVQGSDSASER